MNVPYVFLQQVKAIRQESRGLQLFALFNLFYSLDLFMEIKVIYLFKITHSYAVAANIIAVTVIAAATLEVPTGLFSDLVGRKSTLVAGSICTLLGYLLIAIRWSPWMLILGAAFHGAALALFSGNNTAYLHNLLREQNKEAAYHHYYGKLQALAMVAGIVGTILGGFVANWNIALFMWLNLVPQFLAFICTLGLSRLERSRPVSTSIHGHLLAAYGEIKANVNLRYLSLTSVFGGAGAAAGELQVAAFSVVWPTWALGLARAIQAGMTVPSYFFAGRIIDRFGIVRVIFLNLVTGVSGNILTGLVRNVVSPLFVMLSLPLYGADDVAEQTLLQKEFTEHQRATIASLNSFGNSIYFAIVLSLCGVIASDYGPFVALISTQIFLIPAMVFKLRLLQRVKNDLKDVAPARVTLVDV
jgi:MFS family permease